MKKLAIVTTTVLGLSTLFAGLAWAKSDEIAVIVKSANSTFWQNVRKGAETAGADLGGKYKVTFQGPESETAIDAQVNMVDNAVNRGVAGIVLAASDPVALVPAVRKAYESGIPVVLIDSGLNSDGKYYQSFLATDNRAAGKLAAEKLLAKVKGGKVAVMSFTQGAASAIERTGGFIDEVKSKADYKIVGPYYSNSEMVTALNQTEDVLGSNPDIAAIFGANEPTAVGMARAVKQKGFAGKIVAVGFDGNSDLQNFVRDGTLDGIVVQSSYQMGYKGVDTIGKIIKGEKVEKVIDTGVVYVTKENIDSPEAKAVLY
ncbi:ABC transporter substrate-binding protein [Glaesserella parasuis]|uniref:ABC D-ribose transporter periplasmic-binding compoent RbsB n=2 Tax=Glaesserella parasuis TaxID=738 RepID=B8F7E3_GLAP5|nr:ABC transporter substrate-binding protein [Glaesserella parasuis]AGO17404.1 D-ribose ABC transporter substrate-binding component RbsB [Glaesserella parasuis ZJ0906]ACL33245.1 ABC D-ribose transporter periplasmic-binding compoent RbsB [Glaesserella parasuis SH0165]AIK18075.1 LacI family transcriptional regulator [Glaesserella parasuis]ATW44667.1 LacI family transcriptional regulator [Glaesserella parasuis str. Nagasaki]EQA00092.1 periplasmic binding s and sugar binding domain of LacI family 